MKKHFIPLIAVILIVGAGCRKNRQEGNPPTEPPTEKKWIVTTVAGNGTTGFANGPALSAEFSSPEDVVVATDGSVYVTDLFNSQIRKIKDGQVSTFAGSDSGFVNGNGASAKFGEPYSIALDANGNFYVSDVLDDRIRQISPGGDVTTYTINTFDVVGLFIVVQGIVADAQGNIYVVDTHNQRIRKINANRAVTTIAGNDLAGFHNGIGAAASFNYPSGIAMDKQGNLYVPDSYNYRIRKIIPGGEVSTFAGSGVSGNNDGDAGTARFRLPVDIVIDSKENLYVVDNHCIRKISPEAVVSTIAGSTGGYADGDGASAKFFFPTGLGIDIHDNIYVADYGNRRIRKISFE